MCYTKAQLDGVRRPKSSISINSGMCKGTFINGILQKAQSSFAALLRDILLLTHALVLFVLSMGSSNQEKARKKKNWDRNILFYQVFLWLPSYLFSWSLIKWDIKDSQHKYHLLNVITKVKLVSTTCSPVSSFSMEEWEVRSGRWCYGKFMAFNVRQFQWTQIFIQALRLAMWLWAKL